MKCASNILMVDECRKRLLSRLLITTHTQVLGQTQDLVDLQRILLRGTTKLTDNAQQNMTRWAVYNVASLLRQYGKEYEALVQAMGRGATVDECVAAIEGA